MLGPGPGIGVWITTSLRRDGMLVPMDRGGNPSFNPSSTPTASRTSSTPTNPVDDVENYLRPLAET